MILTAFRDTKPFSQLIFSAFVILVCFILFMAFSMLIAIPVFGINSMLSMPGFSEIDNPETIIMLKYFQTIQAVGLFIIPPFILGYLFHGKSKEYLYLNKSLNSLSLILVLALMIFAGPFINLVGELNHNMIFPQWLSGVEQWMKETEENAAIITEAFLNVQSYGGLAFNIFMIALLPAIGEELLFRGVIQRIFTKMTQNYHWGIWISAILFSAMHVQFYGFIPRVLLGAIFGYLLVWSGSMWLPIVGHFLNNAIAVVAMFLINNKMISPEFEEIGSTSDSYYIAGLSLGLVILVMLFIKRQNAGNQIQLEMVNGEIEIDQETRASI